jgi:drug/metabolite transporter (DMT)-like permease
LTPLLAVTISTLFEGKKWNVVSISGIVLILVGQWLVIRAQNASPEHQLPQRAVQSAC